MTEPARNNLRRKWGISATAPIEIVAATPGEAGRLRAVDDFLWALQRRYLRDSGPDDGEERIGNRPLTRGWSAVGRKSQVWVRLWVPGGRMGTRPVSSERKENPASVCGFSSYPSGGQGTRTLNRQAGT